MIRHWNRLCLLLLTPASSLLAQGLLVGPASDDHQPPVATNRPDHPTRPGVHITRTQIHAEVVDGVATTTIDQVVHNTGGRDAEATWFLPLPAGAVADAFTMTVGGKEVAGEVLDAGQAAQVYESIVRRRRDPGLLEYASEGMLRARIFPIPANDDVAVSVRIRQVLQPTGGMFEWSWPLRVARLGDAAGGPIGLSVHIQSRTPLSTVVTPHAAAEIRRSGEHEATISLEGQNGEFDDLRVLYGLSEQEFGLHMLPYRQGSDPGWFTMLLSPPRTLADAKVPPRCVQLVVDTSGSMKGAKIEQAKASLHVFLESLRAEDRFQVITFASSTQKFFDAPMPATSDNVAAALARVDSLQALGGTNIGDALRVALESVPAGDGDDVLLPQIVFITDGEPTVGLTRPEQILELTKASDRQQARVFALGVGDQIDVRLLDDLVAQHRGARDFVGNKEKIEAKVDALCQKISRPALTDVEVRCDGLDALDVHPTRTRDLFCGEMLQVVGRYRNSGAKTVRVTGKQNGVQKEFVFEVEFPKVALNYPFVQTVWARQHVATLLDAIRHNGQQKELVDEVRAIATQYGIVTPYTSQLIVEEGMRLAGVRDRLDDGRGPAKRYRGPGDVMPPNPGAGGGHNGGPGGPTSPAPLGPATGGPAGPTTGGASKSRGDGGEYHGPELGRLGEKRTGAEAIEESKVVTGSDDFYLGSTRKADGEAADRSGRRGGKAAGRELLRRAVGRVFVPVGEELVEQGLPDDWQEQAVVIEAFSKDYFALLKQKIWLREIIALGDRVVFRDGERIVRIAPTKEPVEAKPAESKPGETRPATGEAPKVSGGQK
ncbi:MAG: VWA domain-containing protein [Planctomycetes bacterium]|nr:VWA domain-containing protein [Planctomycetota bacterium]